MAIINYSGTKCPSCQKTGFELVEDAPSNSNYKLYYLRCLHCKTFLSALDFFPVGPQMSATALDIKKIKDKLGIIEGF